MGKTKKIVNACPHEVSVYIGSVHDPKSGKYRGGTEVIRFPKSGIVASAQSEVLPLPALEEDGILIPACKREFVSVSELPMDGSLYVVSNLYAQAAKELGMNTSHLLTPYGMVTDDTGKTIGCTGLVKYA